MGAPNKVALITGGASGMGLAIAQSLSKQDSWDIHVLDLNASATQNALSSLGHNAQFHQNNVTDYNSLASTFQKIHSINGRIDFVFANAGIAEHANFYARQTTEPPPPPAGLHPLIDINLKAVIDTCYLALHYFRKSPKDADKSIAITASCGGLYPSYYSPIYTATKHAVLGLMRSIAPHYYHNEGIRVNAICPGTVRTNLLSEEEWGNFPEEYFTPVSKIAEVVVMLVEGKEGLKGKEIDGKEEKELRNLWGKAVEISGTKHYFREQPEYCDNAMRKVMGATDIEVLKV